MSNIITFNLEDNSKVIINKSDKTLTHQLGHFESITIEGYDNPLADAPYKPHPVLATIGRILDDIRFDIDDKTGLYDEDNLGLFMQVDSNKYLIKDQSSCSFIALNVEHLQTDKTLSLAFISPFKEPLIFDRVSSAGLEQVWQKYRSDFTDAMSTEIEFMAGKSLFTEEVLAEMGENEEEISWKVTSLNEIIDTLAGFVLNSADMEVLKAELAKLKEVYGEDMAMKGFYVRDNLRGDTVTSVEVYDPNDLPGSSTVLTHGDTTEPHGDKGWAITEKVMTGTEIETSVRYL